MKNFISLVALTATLSSATIAHSQSSPIPIPFKPDPPPAINGDLDEWEAIAPTFILDNAEQIVTGEKGWASKADLSARVWLAWRQEHLYLAADVTDDVLRQTQRGSNLWKGDHLELYVDTTPEADAQRLSYGEGQFQIGLTPGNFENTGDPLFDTKPEGYFHLPAGISAEGVIVAAQRTPQGYTLEAAIPWKNLKITSLPAAGLSLPLVVGVSDTDGTEAAQEKMLAALLPGIKWSRSRQVLRPAALAEVNGNIPVVARGQKLFDSLELAPRTSQEFRFESPAVPAGREAVLVFNTRLHAKQAAGYTPALRLRLNGQALDAKRVLNKEANEELVTGKLRPTAAGESFVTDYAPDFEASDKSASYATRKGSSTRLELNVSDLLKSGSNVLTIENAVRTPLTNTMTIGNASLEFRAPVVKRVPTPPPTGAIPTVAPSAKHTVDYNLREEADGGLTLSLNGQTARVASQYSTPDGKWQTGNNAFFRVQRVIEKRGEAVVVRETFTNLTNENLPLMQRRQLTTTGGFKKYWLGGLSPSSASGSAAESSNPTTFGITDKIGVGLLPLDDVGLVHVSNYATDGTLGLADNTLVVRPGATHTAEWAIVPTAQPDYFSFINATRRLRDVNFLIDGSFAFLRINPELTGKWSDQKIVDFVRNKNAHYLTTGISWPRYNGVVPHGTAFQTLDFTEWKKEIARRRRLVPEAKQLAYFHSFINAHKDASTTYKDARTLLSDGKHADYGEAHYALFVPTDDNTFGRDVAKNVDIILDDLKLDGVYWDEMERSRYSYTYNTPWDGVSADIDPRTLKITRLKSSVALLSQSWRLKQAKRIMERGTLIANGGSPDTRTMMQLHFPSFVETGSISNNRFAQLYSPIALGDHLTERSEEDAYRVMLRSLDFGCVYYWYNDMTVVPTHPTLTSYMFPITPVELREGTIIGKERIITNRSGFYGWNDNAKHEIHVFDNKGREVTEIKAPTVARTITKDGKTLTELRIGEDWSAAIVKK